MKPDIVAPIIATLFFVGLSCHGRAHAQNSASPLALGIEIAFKSIPPGDCQVVRVWANNVSERPVTLSKAFDLRSAGAWIEYKYGDGEFTRLTVAAMDRTRTAPRPYKLQPGESQCALGVLGEFGEFGESEAFIEPGVVSVRVVREEKGELLSSEPVEFAVESEQRVPWQWNDRRMNLAQALGGPVEFARREPEFAKQLDSGSTVREVCKAAQIALTVVEAPGGHLGALHRRKRDCNPLVFDLVSEACAREILSKKRYEFVSPIVSDMNVKTFRSMSIERTAEYELAKARKRKVDDVQ
jgi:hypothetical protein